jgi:hypothetical protein
MENSFEFKMVSSKYIVADPAYQRDINQTRIEKMLSLFDPNLVNAPKVSYRDGKYFVFDGQHTVALLKAKNGNKDLFIRCKVYEGMTQAEEAYYFRQQNGISRTPNTRENFRAAFNFGDKEIVDMVRLAEAQGFTVDFKMHKSPNRIIAVKALHNVYRRYGSSVYTITLSIIKDVWKGDDDSLRNEIIEGMAQFCNKYAGKYDRPLLVRKLSKVLPIKLIREANISGEGGAKKYAKRILAEYNKNLSTSRLDDEL